MWDVLSATTLCIYPGLGHWLVPPLRLNFSIDDLILKKWNHEIDGTPTHNFLIFFYVEHVSNTAAYLHIQYKEQNIYDAHKEKHWFHLLCMRFYIQSHYTCMSSYCHWLECLFYVWFYQQQLNRNHVAFSWSWVDPYTSAALSISPQMLQAATNYSNAATLSACHKTGEVNKTFLNL